MILYSYEANFGGVPLSDVTDLSSQYGRRLASYQPARGDGAEVFDLGQSPRTYSLNATLTGTAAQTAAKRRTLIALADTGEERTFVHPLDGPVPCRLESCTVNDAADATTVGLSLQETRPFSATRIRPVDAVTLAQVEASADLLIDSLAAVPSLLDAPDPDEAFNVAATWDQDTPPQEIDRSSDSVRADYAAIDSQLANSIGSTERAARRASIAFQSAFHGYGRTVVAQARRYNRITVARRTGLRALLVQLYGEPAATALYPDVLARNGIRQPGTIDANTILELPQR